ncbi:Ig-like domain-containing protein [Gallibacterium anatis]|uniref:Ig-like domain-containing protein n=2 Tax=Gallibacterium anatis TaxID=750 RepID=UPI003004BE12
MARGGGSSAHSAPSDTTPPDQPTDVVISNNGDQITGKAEPGSKITIKDDQGNVIANGKADEQGNFSIDLNPPKNNGEKVEVTATDKAGNTSKPTDVTAPDITPPNKPENLDVSDDGTHVTGTAEPGSTVVIRDENGDQIGSATADPETGTFEAELNTPKTNGETLTAEATDGAGNTSPKAGVDADDNTAPPAPTLTNDSEDNKLVATEDKDITGSAPDAAGGTAVLVDGDGNPVKDSAGNPITAPIDNNGNFTLPAAGVPDGDYGVQVKDKAGNSSTDNAPISIDRTVPKITSVEFADNNNPSDNQLTRNEVGTDGKTWVNVNFDKATVKVDDVIKVNGVDHKITEADITAGQAQIEIPVGVAPGSQGTLKITAQITDTAGNQSSTADNSIAVNRAVDGIPRVEYIDNGANGGSKDGTLTAAEIGLDEKVTARIVLPGNLEDGDTVSIPGLSETPYMVSGDKVGDFPIGTNAKGEKYIDVQVPVAEGATSLTTLVVVTVDGTDLPATGNIKVDTVAPQEAPVLTVEGVTAEDTTINAAEAKDGLDLKVTIPQGTQEGDYIIIKDGTTTLLDRPLTKEEAESNAINLTIDAPENGTTVNLTATVKEPREDGIAKTSDPVTATVDTAIPGGADANDDGLGDAAPVITFTQDTQPKDGKLNAAELDGQKAAVTIEVPTDVVINDTLVYTVNGGTEQTVNITAAVKDNGFTVPADQLPATGTITVKAYVKDAAGNRSAEAEEAAKIDTSIGKPTPTAGEDGSVNITLLSDAEKGDTVTVEYTDEAGNSQTVTLTKGDDGWTSDKPELINHPTGDTATIPEDGVKDNTPVEITAKDTAGNTSSADSFKAPDVTAPSKPEFDEPQDDGSVKINLPTDANPGDQVKVTVTPEGATEPTTVTLKKQPDGTWESDKPEIINHPTGDTATIPEDQVKDGSQVTAVATDGTNSSDPTTADATDTRTPMLSLTEQSADKVLGKDEGNSITGKVTYDSTEETADKAEGATVILKNAQGEQVAKTTAAADGTFTFASVADGTYSIEVTSASNVAGTPITDVLVDHKAPEKQDITLANDTAGASATDNISYDGTLVTPTLGDGESIKSVTVGDNPVPVVNGKYVLNPGVYEAESIKVVVQDKAGHETTSTNSKAITIDTTAPGQPTIEPQTNGSVNITLPSGENVKADDTVEVTYTDESGVKQTVTFTKGEDGWTSDKPTLIANPTGNTATIPAASVQDGSEVNAVAKDPAGNASTAALQKAGNNPDTTAPSAPDLTQKADGTMDVVLPEDAKPGDTVEVTVIPEGGTAENPTKVTLEKQPDGTWKSDKPGIIDHPTGDTATIPENQVKDGSPVTAVATDDAGNSSAPTTKNATDTRTPVVSLTGDSDDKVLKATEGDDITGTVKYSDGDIAEGAKVILVNTVTHAETASVVADKDGKFTFADVADGTYSIKVTSASGTPGTGVDKVVVDHGVPGDASSPLDGTSDQAPSVVFVDDKNPKDGVLTRNEVGSDGKVKVEVTLPTANVEAGDTVVLTTNGSTEPVKHTLTADAITAGKITAEVPVGAIGATEKQDLTVTAKVVDAAGQSSKEGTDGIPVDRTVNGTPSIEYVEDTGSTVNGTLVGKEDGILWASENAAGDNDGASTTVKVNLPKGIGGENSTDTVTITINDKIYTLSSDGDHVGEEGAATYSIVRPAAESNEDPYVEIPVATTAISQIDAEVEVTYKKVGENTPTTVGTDGVVTLTIDSVVPGGDSDNNNQGDDTGKPTLAIDDAADSKVTETELSDGKVVATVTLPEGVQKGDHIILKDANDNVLADVQVDTDKAKDDVVTIGIPKSKLPDGDYKVTATVKEDGTNGRESAPSNEVSFKVDTDAPNAPELTVNNGGVNIALPADAQKGDTVEVKYTDENGDEQTVILTKGDNGWTSDTKDVIPDTTTTSPNTATLPANQVKDGTEVNATASDSVNPDVPATPVTVNDTRTPVITLTDQSADGKLTKVDNETNIITGKVAYSDEDSAEGATVTLVAENETEKTATVQPDGTFKFENVDDGVYTVKAITAGGVAASNTPTVTVALNSPASASITLKNDNGTDANDNISNDGTLAIDPKGATIVDGSVEYSKDGGEWTDVPVVNGKYVLPEDGTYSVRVTTEDNVGNTTTTTVDGFKVDTKEPADATIKLTEDTGESKSDNISKEGGLTITPADDATIQKVEYQDATGWHTFEGETYTLPAGTYAAGAIKVTTVDTAGNTKETFNTDVITVDQTPPTQGTVTIAKDSGTSVEDGITNDGTLVTPTLGEGESIKSVIADGETIDAVDGKYVLPEKTYGAGTIKVTVVDKAGNETVSTNAAPITVDKTLPIEPTVTPATADGDGSVTVGLPTDAKVGDKVEVSVTPEGATDPVTITLTKGENNSWTPSADLPTGVTLNGDTLTIGEDAVEDGTPVNAKSIDVAGNENAATAGNAGNDALSTTPTVTVTDSKNGYVNKTAMETDGGLNGTTTHAPDGSTIKLLDKNGNPVEIGTVTVTGDTFTIPADKVPEGDYKITVTTPTADGGKTSAPTPLFTVDKTVSAPSLSTTGNDGDGSVTVGLPTDAKVGDKVEVSVTPEGATQPEIVTLTKGETGWTSNKPAIIANTTSNTATIPENAVQDGSTVTAKSVDTADNEAVASPDATAGNDALAADPEVTVAEAADGYVNKAELGNSGLTGETENAPNGSKVELLDEEGTPVDIGTVTVTDGTFTIPADKVPNNGTYTIKVTTPEADGAKEVSTSPFTVDTAAPEITGHRFITNDATGVNDANGDGSITYSELNGQTTVKYEVSFSGAVENTSLSVRGYSIDGSNATGAFNVPVTLTAEQAAAGKVTVEIPITSTPDSTTKEGNIRVTRIALQDPAKNSDAETGTDGVVDSLHIDMTPPSITMDAEEITNGVNKDELSNGIPGTVANAPTGAKVQLYKGEEEVGEPITVGAGGAFTIPSTTADGDYTVKLVGYDDITADFTVDTTVHAPTVTASTENGNGGVTVALPTTDVKVGDKVEVTFTGEDEQPVTITLTKGQDNWAPSEALPTGVDLSGDTLTIGEDAVKDGSEVKAKSVDTAGNEAEADSATAGSDELTPSITMDAEVDNGVNKDELSNGIPGTVANAPTGAKVQLYKGDAKVGSPVEVGEGGTFTILKDGVTDDEGYTVKLVGQEGTVASAPFKVDTTAPEAGVTAKTDGSVGVTLPASPENGDTVTITYTPTGANQATTATLTYDGSNWTGIPDGFTLADGTVTIPADKVADNTIVKAVGSDLAGNTQSPAASGTTAADPVTAVTVKDLTEDGVVLDGSNGTNNTIDFVKAADLGGVVSVKGPAGTTSTVTFTSANGQTVEKTVSNDGTEKAINLTPEQVKTLTGGGSQAISVKVATGDLGEQNYSDVFTINPTSGVFELIPSVNNVSTNDSVHPEVDAVLNGTEQALGAGGKDTAISYMLIIPSTAKIGDKVTVYNGTTEVPFILNTQAKVDSWKAGKTGLRYNIDLDESTLSTGQEITLKAIYTPKDGQPQTLSHTYWYDGVAPTVSVEATNTTATVTLPTVSDAASVTVNVGKDTVTLVKDGSNWVSQAGNTITPAIENGKAVFSDLATGTTVTATATDTVGNTSAEVSAVTQIIPMSISAVSVTDENSTTDGVQVVDNDVNFSYTLAGQLDEGKLIRVRVVDESGAAVGETKYFTPTQGETTDSLALPAADGQALKVVADIVDAVYRDSAVDGSAKNAAFTLDNVASHNASLTGKSNSNVTIDGTPVDHTFGTARNDKYYDVGNVRVHNPKLDWEMRWEDNTMPGKGAGTPPGNWDNANGSEYHLDTALNWSESKDGYKYYWTGVADKSHVIIAAKVRTDDGYDQAYKQGLIGTENAYDGKTHFEMNTNSNLADYIQSEGIVGNVNISTQGGDDTITTKYLNGKYWMTKADFNGSERIFMGDGNDTFEVTGSARSTGYGDSLADNAAFYMTNAKIDMGGGNDIVKITGGQITAGRESDVGNYFLLGSGNDVMETRTITSEKDENEATNIINLGSGHDTLTVNGDIMSHEDAVYSAANPRNGTDQQARFLLMSRDSSDVHITGNVGGKVTMLMGSGDDNIRIDKELWMSDKANAMDWLSITLNRAEISGNKDYYINEDSNSIRGEINTALAAGVKNSGATGLGATSLTNNQNVLEQDDLHITDIAARIDLGDGNNIFTVGGVVTNANILSGEGKDVVKLGFHSGLSGDASFNWSAATDNTKVWTGAGNDLVMMVNVANNVKVYTSADSDDIQLYNVNGKNNEIHAGSGGDIIRLYGVVNNSNSNTIDGGADYDKVIIGNKNDSAASKFLVGGSADGYTNFWSIEEIQFNSGVSGSGDTVKVNAQILNDNHTLYIRGTSELNAQGTEALGVNTVDIDKAVWKDEGTTTKELSDGTSYTYHHYSYVHDNTTEHLYIQNGIRVL